MAALHGMVAAARRALADGRPIVIYPEGTRVAPSDKHPYHVGVAALYRALKVPVVPVALNSGHFWPRRSMKLQPGVITIEFLPTLSASATRHDFIQSLEDSIETASKKLNDVVSAATPGKQK